MQTPPDPPRATPHADQLAAAIKGWAREVGFDGAVIAGIELGEAAAELRQWLADGYDGEMGFMGRHAELRADPARLEPGTLSVISVRLEYWPGGAAEPWENLSDGARAYVSRYALGRDYHKLMRKRLNLLAARIAEVAGPFHCRPFVDSAPVLEKALARSAGLGWRGKHTNLLTREGSWFFLGELFTDLPLPPDAPGADHCGSCTRCLDVCPTAAFVGPYRLDARRCISYLTIEHHGPIPEALRPLMGNRIYGCDDCQLVCPWNRFAHATAEADFAPRHGLDRAELIDLFAWDEAQFMQRFEGSPIRRIGHLKWLRNLAVALGNGPASEAARAALHQREGHDSELVREHVAWALKRFGEGGG